MVKVQKCSKKEEDIDYVLSLLEVEKLAHQTNFYQRSPQKITASSLVKGFWQMQQLGLNSLNKWAVQVGSIIGSGVNKQSVDNRLSQAFVDLCQSLVKKALNARLHKDWLSTQKQELNDVLSQFNRILIQDSTLQKLPACLYEHFGGTTAKTAFMRIQSLFDFTGECWLDFSVDTYAENDQSRADWGRNNFAKKDLLIRDLGYFSLAELGEIIDNQYIISSSMFGVHLFESSGMQINLLELLKQKKELDIDVLVGKQKQLPLRLVVKKLSDKERKKKVQKAKKKRKEQNKKDYSKEYYELLGYEIYLTNLDRSLDIEVIGKLYGLRWYIEILFKAWKSHFNFKVAFDKKMTYNRALISIYLILVNNVYINNYVYWYINQKVKEQSNKQISILQFMSTVNGLFTRIINIKSLSELDKLVSIFIKNAVYENRTKRKNVKEKYNNIIEIMMNDTS